MSFRKIFMLLIIVFLTASYSFRESDSKKEINSIVIKLKSDNGMKRIEKSFPIKEYRSIFHKIYIAKFNEREGSGDKLVKKLENLPFVDWVSLDYKVKALSIPDDSLFEKQYYLRNRGEEFEANGEVFKCKEGADIKAISAWDYLEESGEELYETVVAVLDTGINYKNPDLQGRILEGYNFIHSNSYPFDDNGHGTAVSGIIAANTNNGIGIAGICKTCKILPIKVLDKNGEGTTTTIALGIIKAVKEGARVINISAGLKEESPLLLWAVKYAYDNGVVIVAPTGDSGERAILYPAAYDDYVLAIGATNCFDKVTVFSNYGPEIDVVAPGRFLYTTRGKKYGFVTGTSASAAVVSGIAGIILSEKPFLTPDEVFAIIRYTADDINKDEYPEFDEYAGFGRVNLFKAVSPIVVDKN